jgi:hypothetical protein
MGWSNQVVKASEVIIGGFPDSLFVYNGNPGPGDLIAWIVSQVGTIDPYGNAVPGPVIGTQNAGGDSVRLNGPALILAAAGASVAPASVTQTPAGVLEIDSGGTTLLDASASLFLFSTNAGGLGVPGASLDVGMGLYGSSPIGGPQSWEPMTLLNGWANNPGFGRAEFRPLGSPPNSIEVTGAISAAAAANAVFAQIPVAYGTPLAAAGRPCHTNTGNNAATSVAGIRWNTSFNLSVASNAALPNGATYFFGFTIPVDAPA